MWTISLVWGETQCGDVRIRLYVFLGGAITDDKKFVIEPSIDMERLI